MKNQYQYLFVTAGPYNSEILLEYRQDQLNVVIHNAYGNHVEQCKVSWEISKDGYKHVHIALHLRTPRRFRNFVKQLKFMIDQMDSDPTETRKSNVAAYFPPVADVVIGANNKRWEIMTRYLTCPSKDKTVGDVLEFEAPDYQKCYVGFPYFCTVFEDVQRTIAAEKVNDRSSQLKEGNPLAEDPNYGQSLSQNTMEAHWNIRRDLTLFWKDWLTAMLAVAPSEDLMQTWFLK